MELDLIYKTRVGESHAAGLQAVFDAGAESVFLPSDPVPAPAPAPAPIPALLKTPKTLVDTPNGL